MPAPDDGVAGKFGCGGVGAGCEGRFGDGMEGPPICDPSPIAGVGTCNELPLAGGVGSGVGVGATGIDCSIVILRLRASIAYGSFPPKRSAIW